MAAVATLIDEFRARWNDPARAAQPALIAGVTTTTYAELADQVARVAGWLRNAGVQRGDFVALAMERSAAQVLALLGTLAAGACPCPLEPRLSGDETARRIEAVGLAWLVHDANHKQLAEQSSLGAARCLAWDEHAPHRHEPAWDQGVPPDAPGLLLFTSGSTGNPKGVLLSHRGLLCNARGVAAHTDLRGSDRLLHVMPLHHTNAINNQILAPLYAGSAIALGGRFRAEDMPALLQQHEPTIITGVPTMYARMLDLRFDQASLARLRFARCGSAPITEALHRRIEAFLGCELVVSYGLSEATCTSTMNPPHARRVGSVGTVLAGQAVRLRNTDGSAVPAGAEGEICIAGDSLMSGYLGLGDGHMLVPPEGGMLRTGDLGRFDEDGYLYVTGRIKDVIIRGGENISPAQIERLLAALPDVASCCVVAGPHADLGEVPVAFVVARNGGAPDEARIRGTVLRELGRIYVPERVIAMSALPENAVGKVDRKALAALLHDAVQH
jgi:acyl-CoA synthetase (AMP-forming)/AMP-acid ligase II